jgi:hypothetical protein
MMVRPMTTSGCENSDERDGTSLPTNGTASSCTHTSSETAKIDKCGKCVKCARSWTQCKSKVKQRWQNCSDGAGPTQSNSRRTGTDLARLGHVRVDGDGALNILRRQQACTRSAIDAKKPEKKTLNTDVPANRTKLNATYRTIRDRSSAARRASCRAASRGRRSAASRICRRKVADMDLTELRRDTRPGLWHGMPLTQNQDDGARSTAYSSETFISWKANVACFSRYCRVCSTDGKAKR